MRFEWFIRRDQRESWKTGLNVGRDQPAIDPVAEQLGWKTRDKVHHFSVQLPRTADRLHLR